MRTNCKDKKIPIFKNNISPDQDNIDVEIQTVSSNQQRTERHYVA